VQSKGTQTRNIFAHILKRYATLIEFLFERMTQQGFRWHFTSGALRGNPHVNLTNVVESIAAHVMRSQDPATLLLVDQIIQQEGWRPRLTTSPPAQVEPSELVERLLTATRQPFIE
jgi:hypothetical protein